MVEKEVYIGVDVDVLLNLFYFDDGYFNGIYLIGIVVIIIVVLVVVVFFYF